MKNNYQPNEIKNFLYNDLCDFIENHQDLTKTYVLQNNFHDNLFMICVFEEHTTKYEKSLSKIRK